MSYSKLVSYVRVSPHKYMRDGGKIDKITIHHMAGNLSVETCGEVFQERYSANYGIGSDGRIACYAPEEYRAVTSSSYSNDNRAITIEVANCTGSPDWKVSEKAYIALIDLCVDICQRHGFKLNFTGNKNGNLTMHKWFANTLCPGPYLESRFSEIASEVNKRLGEDYVPIKVENKEECVVNLSVLRKGSKGAEVKALQILLIGHKYPCGLFGADGDFGSSTDAAVRKFQKAKNLTADGIVGKNTWSALLGV
jgi:hypothetical protein